MRTVILEAFTDEEFGNLGLRIVDAPRGANAATDGLLLAHDLIEHVNGLREIGSIDDELEALGAIWYVRGQHDDLRRDNVGSMYSVHENIASDVVRMFSDFFYGAHVTLNAPRTVACDADEDFREIIRCALKSTRAEVGDPDKSDDEIIAQEKAYIAVCLPRMRIGYRKARRKYEGRGRSRYAANNLFWEISDAVEPHAKHASEGQRYRLTYGFESNGNARAYCEESYEDSDYV